MVDPAPWPDLNPAAGPMMRWETEALQPKRNKIVYLDPNRTQNLLDEPKMLYYRANYYNARSILAYLPRLLAII